MPDAILQKPGRLTEEEMEEMKLHVVHGAETLEKAMKRGNAGQFLQMAADVARYHHERWNGKGYCAGLSGPDIPLSARIVALVDVFDALTSKRCYKSAQPVDQVREIIQSESGAHFDPVIVEAFLTSYPKFVEIVQRHQTDAVDSAVSPSTDCEIVPPAGSHTV